MPTFYFPSGCPFLSQLANRYLAHVPVLRGFCLTNWIVARPLRLPSVAAQPSVSVICPCRNEAGNIQQIVNRLPSLGEHTELIFVEGNSKDDTLATCRRVAASTPQKDITVLVQEGRGKGDAVRLGFSRAKGDILMILDADMSVAPEDLVHFYNALVSGKGEFVNGCRLVYTMDAKAMRFLNLIGNRFFALLLSKLIGQPIKDSLCGTKVLWRSKYEELARGRAYFGDVDPFGDFDLLFWSCQTQPEDSRDSHPLPSEDLRINEHQPFRGWLALAAHVGQGGREIVLRSLIYRKYSPCRSLGCFTNNGDRRLYTRSRRRSTPSRYLGFPA